MPEQAEGESLPGRPRSGRLVPFDPVGSRRPPAGRAAGRSGSPGRSRRARSARARPARSRDRRRPRGWESGPGRGSPWRHPGRRPPARPPSEPRTGRTTPAGHPASAGACGRPHRTPAQPRSRRSRPPRGHPRRPARRRPGRRGPGRPGPRAARRPGSRSTTSRVPRPPALRGRSGRSGPGEPGRAAGRRPRSMENPGRPPDRVPGARSTYPASRPPPPDHSGGGVPFPPEGGKGIEGLGGDPVDRVPFPPEGGSFLSDPAQSIYPRASRCLRDSSSSFGTGRSDAASRPASTASSQVRRSSDIVASALSLGCTSFGSSARS